MILISPDSAFRFFKKSSMTVPKDSFLIPTQRSKNPQHEKQDCVSGLFGGNDGK